MKTLKYLTICSIVIFLFTGNVFAACTKQLDDSLSPNEDTFEVGDTINYAITLSIPQNNGGNFCSLENFQVEFLNPAAVSSTTACGDPNRVLLYSTTSFDPGETVTFTGPGGGGDIEDPALSYVIQEGDLIVGTSGKVIVALLCSSWDGALGRDVDNKSLVNYVINPAVCVTKVPSCEETIVGYPVSWDITIENCGDTELDLISVNDSLFGNLTSSVPGLCQTLPVDANCTFTVGPYTVTGSDPDPLINVVDVNYLVVGTAFTVYDEDEAQISIVDPDFTVTKVCQTPEVIVGNDANFLVTVENTGDVALDFTSAELGSFSLNPLAKKEVIVTKTATECPSVSNQVSVTGSYTGGTDDCLYWEDTKTSELAACDVVCPSFDVIKECLGDVDFENDPNAYFNITITNTGDVELTFILTDPNAGIPSQGPFTIPALGNEVIPVAVPVVECGGPVSNEATVLGYYISEETWFDIKTATDECPCEERGDEGCTPGFWKNSPGCWCGDYGPLDPVAGIFTALLDPNYADFQADSLMDALKYGGGRGVEGAARNLLRHGTAALLNACKWNVEFLYTEEEVIEKVNDALASMDRRTIETAKNELAIENERGCPISSDNAPEGIACERHDEVEE